MNIIITIDNEREIKRKYPLIGFDLKIAIEMVILFYACALFVNVIFKV